MIFEYGKLSCGDTETTQSSEVNNQSGVEILFLCSRKRICRVGCCNSDRREFGFSWKYEDLLDCGDRMVVERKQRRRV